jgi:hypothetical protein
MYTTNSSQYIEDLKGMIEERLQAYWDDKEGRKDETQLPEHILFYRDGVSES